MRYKHKNKGTEVIRIHDHKWKAYDLKPGDEVIINKCSPRDSVFVIEEIKDIPKKIIKKRKINKIKGDDYK